MPIPPQTLATTDMLKYVVLDGIYRIQNFATAIVWRPLHDPSPNKDERIPSTARQRSTQCLEYSSTKMTSHSRPGVFHSCKHCPTVTGRSFQTLHGPPLDDLEPWPKRTPKRLHKCSTARDGNNQRQDLIHSIARTRK